MSGGRASRAHRRARMRTRIPLAASAIAVFGIAALAAACSPGDRPPPLNLILVSIDTLRADRLGAYGYSLPTSPGLDGLARRAVRFERAYSTAPWTLPSHMTMLTGLHPSRHGTTRWATRVSDEIPTLAEILGRAGYRSFGYTTGGFVAARYGFARGFERYEDDLAGFAMLLSRARATIESLRSEEPYFVFVQTFATHCPYATSDRYERGFQRRPASDRVATPGLCLKGPDLALSPAQKSFLSNRYDASIRTADDQLLEFVAALDSAGELARTVLVVVSDHGEEFGEHGGLFHGRTLHEEVLRVPLLVLAPGFEARVVREPVSLVDLFATLLELLEMPAPSSDGRSLVAAMRGEAEAAERAIFSETDNEAHLRGLTLGQHKLILDLANESVTLFDLAADPGEQHDLSELRPELRAKLRARLERHLADSDATADSLEAELSPEHVEQLRALGYAE